MIKFLINKKVQNEGEV